MNLKKLKVMTAVIVMSAPIFAHAKDLINVDALIDVLQDKKVSNHGIERGAAAEIKNYNDIQRIEVSDQAGYSQGLTLTLRAEMFGDNSYNHAVHGQDNSMDVYALPAVIYFPDNPQKDPLKIQSSTVEVGTQVWDDVLNSAEVKVQTGALSGKKSPWIVYGQTVVGNTNSTVTQDGEKQLLDSAIDISGMSEKKAKKYFKSYATLITQLNQELSKMNYVHMEKWSDEQEEIAKKRLKALEKETFTTIESKEDFAVLAGYQVNAASEVDEPKSEFGHWAYDDNEADKKYAVGIEVINYGTYFELVYLVAHDESLDEREHDLDAMHTKMTEQLQDKISEGAKSVQARDSGFSSITDIVTTYSLDGGISGKSIAKNIEKFSKFVKKTYKKMDKLAEKSK